MYDKEDNGLKLSNSWAGYYILLNPDFKQQVWVGCGDGRKQGMSMASGGVGVVAGRGGGGGGGGGGGPGGGAHCNLGVCGEKW
jgi:hypothetical protein